MRPPQGPARAGAQSARDRWRAIRGAHLVAPVRAGATFENGVLVERSAVRSA